MEPVEVSERRLAEARAQLVRQIEDRFPTMRGAAHQTGESRLLRDDPGADLGLVPMITTDEIRVLAITPYASAVVPGVVAFDWTIVERALGRHLTSVDHRVLKEAAVRSIEDDLDSRLLAITASIDAATSDAT